MPIVLIIFDLLIIRYFPPAYLLFIRADTVDLLLLLFIVTVSAWFGGFGPGILATIITAVLNYYVLLLADLAIHPLIGDQLVTVIYIVLGFIISMISEARYQSEAQKNQFIGLVAHELKNPLSSIKGFSELIDNLAKKSHLSKLREYTSIIEYQSEKLMELIDDLLDITKVEVGKFEYKDEPFNFGDLVKEVVDHQKIIQKDRQITMSNRSRKIIMGDRYRIGQVVVNLLTNAFKYSPPDSKVKVRTSDQKGGVVLSVQDFGIGIPFSEQHTIFSQYYRTKSAEKGKAKGLGLGLYISSQIVEHHQGKLWVKSREGHGSTFSLELPSNRLNRRK